MLVVYTMRPRQTCYRESLPGKARGSFEAPVLLRVCASRSAQRRHCIAHTPCHFLILHESNTAAPGNESTQTGRLWLGCVDAGFGHRPEFPKRLLRESGTR